MVNKKIKKFIMFLVVFTMFFIGFKTVNAETITCNYSDPSNGTSYAMKYNNEKLTLVPTITVQSQGEQPITIGLISAEFNVNDVKSGCPSNIYSLLSSSESTAGAYDLKFFLSSDAAKKYATAKGHEHWKNSLGMLTTLPLKNNTDYSKTDSCEYYEVTSGNELSTNKLIIYYDKTGKTSPEISIGGKFSSDSLIIKPNFSSITSCPTAVYSVTTSSNGIEGTINVYLDETKARAASKNYVTYTNQNKYGAPSTSSDINKIDTDTDLDLGGGTITIDCSSFTALHTIYVMILILAPIAVIVLGSIDYAKAVMASDEEKMKKFKKKLPKRIIAVVLLFMTPFIVNGIVETFLGGRASTMLCITKGYSDPITIQSSSEKSTSVLDTAPAGLKSACSSQCSSMSPTAEIQCTKTCVSNYDKTCEKVTTTSDKKKCYKNYAKSYKSDSNK